jgi:hypothetical protein
VRLFVDDNQDDGEVAMNKPPPASRSTQNPLTTISPMEMALLYREYAAQAIKPGGLAVDRMAYTDNIAKIAAVMAAAHPDNGWDERKVNRMLMALRKTGLLVNFFRKHRGDDDPVEAKETDEVVAGVEEHA